MLGEPGGFFGQVARKKRMTERVPGEHVSSTAENKGGDIAERLQQLQHPRVGMLRFRSFRRDGSPAALRQPVKMLAFSTIETKRRCDRIEHLR